MTKADSVGAVWVMYPSSDWDKITSYLQSTYDDDYPVHSQVFVPLPPPPSPFSHVVVAIQIGLLMRCVCVVSVKGHVSLHTGSGGGKPVSAHYTPALATHNKKTEVKPKQFALKEIESHMCMAERGSGVDFVGLCTVRTQSSHFGLRKKIFTHGFKKSLKYKNEAN